LPKADGDRASGRPDITKLEFEVKFGYCARDPPESAYGGRHDDDFAGGANMTTNLTFEREGSKKPVCVDARLVRFVERTA
jgi:hypothetical protein